MTSTRQATNPAALDQAVAMAPVRWAYARDAAVDLGYGDLTGQLTDEAHHSEGGGPPPRWLERLPAEVVVAALGREVNTLESALEVKRGELATAQRTVKALRAAARRLLAEADPATLAQLREAAL